jgi:hypothetical protein
MRQLLVTWLVALFIGASVVLLLLPSLPSHATPDVTQLQQRVEALERRQAWFIGLALTTALAVVGLSLVRLDNSKAGAL